MKRIIILVLIVLMVGTIIVPMNSFAQNEEDIGLESVIKIVKRKFDIPESCKFEYYHVYENQEKEKIWNLNWYDNEKNIGFYITITEAGIVLNYNYSEPYVERERKFPEFDEEKAIENAEDFIREISPASTLSKITKHDAFQNPIFNRFYYFDFYRIVNGVPFFENNVHISVDANTGKIYNYSYNIDDKLIFSSADDAISTEDAEKEYIEKLGLWLIYKYNYDYKTKELNIFPAYVPKYDNNQYAIDAITGDKVQIGGYGVFRGSLADTASDEEDLINEKENIMKAAGIKEEPRLTPEEIEAVKGLTEIITEKEAEKIAREIPENDLDEGYILNSWNLSRDWPFEKELIYNMSFRKEIKDENQRYLYADVTLNAKSGEIKRFYKDYSYTEKEPKFDEISAKSEIEKYLEDFIPEKFKETEFKEEETFKNPDGEPQRYFYFNYIRKINGILFPDNRISVGFDAVVGKITSFNTTWFDTDFPKLDNIISFEDANESLFKNIGIELQYKRLVQEQEEDDKIINLVFLLKSGKPFILDANTGSVLNYDGKPFREEKPIEYGDIKGHFAEEKIKELVKYRIIGFTDSEYRPNEYIAQKDFFSILIKIVDRYYGPIIKVDSEQDEIDEMYKQLLQIGIIKEDEKDPESQVMREDAVKFIIRALKYEKVADMPNIFKMPFLDGDDIDKDLIGYIAIAKGLKIIEGAGGKFNAKNNLTRAEGAVMIYNCFKK
jgi:uncharacterized membrane protein YkoI